MSLYDDTLNPDWEPVLDLPGWEPWEPDEVPEVHAGGCAYCGAPDVRDRPDPWGGRPCCDVCFARLVGDESDEPTPWRCACEFPTGGGARPTHPSPATAGRSLLPVASESEAAPASAGTLSTAVATAGGSCPTVASGATGGDEGER